MGGRQTKPVVETTAEERLDLFDQQAQAQQQAQQNSQENVNNNSQNVQEETNMNAQNNNNQNNNQSKGKFHEEHPIIFGGLLVAGGAAVGAAACYFVTQKLNDPCANNNYNSAFKVSGGIN